MTFYEPWDAARGAEIIAEHIRKFWDPRMRAAILAHLDAGGAGLDPNVRDAIATLKAPSAKSPG